MRDHKAILINKANRVIKALEALGRTGGAFDQTAIANLHATLQSHLQKAIGRLPTKRERDLAYDDLLPKWPSTLGSGDPLILPVEKDSQPEKED